MARIPAQNMRINDIINGKYFPGDKVTMKASYAITPFGQKISRVNIVASVTDKFMSEYNSYWTITIDDSTGAMRVKCFKEGVNVLDGVEVGDVILVVGRVKEYNNEIYINGEIAKKVTDKNYENFRKLEILDKLIDTKRIADEIKTISKQMPEEELKKYVKIQFGIDEEQLKVILESKSKEVDYTPEVMKLIESLDEGKGVEVGKIFETSKLKEDILERTINDLLESGLLYEPNPGMFKLV